MVLKNSKALWVSCLKYIEQNVKPEDYDNLFAYITFKEYVVAEKSLVLNVPNGYICEQVERRFLDVMRTAIGTTFGRVRLTWDISVVKPEEGMKGVNVQERSDDASVVLDMKPKEEYRVAPGTAENRNLPPIDSLLNVHQTFRTFIQGESNMLSRSIGLNVAEHPNSTQFNPMFIFGPSGCGKTHLVNAIGNRCKELYPGKRVLCVSARTFQAQYTTSVMQGKINDFIAFYQTIDMLIVDDVQEWMKATGTQDTFFHIFNHLYRNSRRIVLVSDRPPVELEGMNRRLITRFICGMTAEMDKPNYDLCVDILKRKIARDGLTLPEDVIQFIAHTADGSVRDLEGVVNSLMAYSVVYGCDIDMALAERVIKRAVKIDNMPLTVDDILERVCKEYEVTPNAVKSRSRKKELVVPRQLTMFFANKYTNIPATRIGRMIGSRDHSTVLHSIAKVEDALRKDKAFVEQVKKIEKALQLKS